MRPLSRGVDTLLTSWPRATAPADLRTRLLAAHARRGVAPRSAFSLAWEGSRPGLLAGAVTAGLAVVAFSGAIAPGTADAPRSAMVDARADLEPLAREVADLRVAIVHESLDPGAFAAVGAPRDGGP